MVHAKKLAAVAALALVLLVYAVSLASESTPRSSSEPAQPRAPLASAAALESEDSRTGPARESVSGAGPDEAPSDSAPAADEPALAALEIQVLRGDAVAHDTRAWLVSGYHRELPGDLRTPAPGYTPVFAAADARGVVRFDGLAPGAYRAALELDDLRLEQAVRLLEGRELARIVIRLGSATVEGFVFDEQGAPAAAALVQLRRPGYGRNPPPAECFARTDANGFYRFRQVASGLQSVTARPTGSLSERGSVRECVVPADGVTRLDFGSTALEGVSWTGTVRNPAGDPIPGPGELRVRAEDRDEGHEEVHTLPLRADGSFELHLRPGTHHLWVQPAGFFPQQVDLGRIELPASGLQRDLVLPGARLHLWLTPPAGWDGAPSPSVRARNELQVRMQLVPLADGSWVRDGFAPGDYVLSAAPLDFEATHGPEFPFSFQAGRDELVLELRLAARP